MDGTPAVLSRLASNDKDPGIAGTSGPLDLSPIALQRIARALVAHGFLKQNTGTGRWLLEWIVPMFGAPARFNSITMTGNTAALENLEEIDIRGYPIDDTAAIAVVRVTEIDTYPIEIAEQLVSARRWRP